MKYFPDLWCRISESPRKLAVNETARTFPVDDSRRRFLITGACALIAAGSLPGLVLSAPGDGPEDYVCPPCGQSCDKLTFDAPGKCPQCGMTLILKSERDQMNAIAAEASKSPLTGSWAGVYSIGSEQTAVRFDFAATGSGLKATVDFPGQNGGFDLVSLKTSDQGFSGETSFIGEKLSFDARANGSQMSGRVDVGGRTGKLELQRVFSVSLSSMRPWEGIYRSGSRSFLLESINEVYPCSAIELPSGSIRSLVPIAPEQFIAGPTLLEPVPVKQRFTFVGGNGGARGVIVSDGGTEIKAAKLPLRSEEIKFQNGDVTLAGTLVLPNSGGPHPAVIFMHGSGANPRTSFFGFGYLLASLGFAVLKYDKRGSGESTGAFTTYEDLAKDALAGARLLQSRADIDPERIGFWGISEGGWTAPEAASRFDKAAFVIIVSGGGLSPAEGELYDSEDQLRSDGRFSDSDIQQALAFQRARDQYARSGRGWDNYAALLKVAVTKAWYNYPTTDLYGAAKPKSSFWKNKARTYFYDPLPALRRVRCPVLVVRGGMDDPVGGRLAMDAIRKALAKAGNADVTMHVIPHADHNLFAASRGDAAELPRTKRLAPEALPLMTKWLQTRTHRDRRTKANK